eukprot:2662979-Rhodomonas_salina.1
MMCSGLLKKRKGLGFGKKGLLPLVSKPAYSMSGTDRGLVLTQGFPAPPTPADPMPGTDIGSDARD